MKHKNPTASTFSKTLSTRAASILHHFNDLNQPAFTLDEVAAIFPESSRNSVKKLIGDMVKRGLLLRVKEGIFWIIPYDQDPATYFPNTHLLAGYLVGKASYYIGYYSALELHSLITQPSFREQIVVNKQVKPATLKIRSNKFQFIYHHKDHFFGMKSHWIDSYSKAYCSDLEKTFIDCLYKPDYAGGITEIVKALYKSKGRLDFDKLLNYCIRFKAQSVIKRLGFLLELLEIENLIVPKLHRIKTKSFVLLEPSYENKGNMISRWSVRQNISTEEITSPIYS